MLTLQRSGGKLFTMSIKETNLRTSPDMTRVFYFYISQVVLILKKIWSDVNFHMLLKYFVAAVLHIWQEVVMMCHRAAFCQTSEAVTAKWALKMLTLMLNKSIWALCPVWPACIQLNGPWRIHFVSTWFGHIVTAVLLNSWCLQAIHMDTC